MSQPWHGPSRTDRTVEPRTPRMRGAALAAAVCGWLLAACAVLPAIALSAPLLLLDERIDHVDAWPAVTVLPDPDKTLTVGDVLAAPERFEAPTQAHATLGLRQEAMWLRIPIQVSPHARVDWILDIDYPPLNRIDMHLVVDGAVVQRVAMGSLLPFSQRPLRTRSHAVPLTLQAGAQHIVLLRIETGGAMTVPITLSTPAAFQARAINEQMLQGLLGGLGLCLLLYSLGQWVNVREPLYGKYALLISGSLLFSALVFGVGAQYLWTDNTWFETHMAGLSALMAACGSFLFIEQALRGPDRGRYFSRVMKGGAVLTVTLAVVYVLGLLETRTIAAIVSLIGPLPALIGIPGAVARARRGDPVGPWFLFGWLVYFVTTAIMIGVINGGIGANFWTMHAFQFGATIDMLVFMRVLGLRAREAHAAALSAHRERDALRSLADSDPLTGLPNRRGLNRALDAALLACSPRRVVAVYLIDLDGFKPVNDRYGHDVGDDLLVAVARRLRANIRSTDVVARLGGDEFVVMAGGLPDEAQAQALGQQLLDAFRKPFDVGAERCHIGLTIGYVLAPLDSIDPAGLLRLADAAMYAGKQAGKNRLHRGEPGLALA